MADFDPETFFEGKTIRFVTSSGAGGGTDLRTRMLASHLIRFIPGDPAVQVSNVTPHVAGMNFLWNQEPDGLTVMLTSAPPLEFQLFEGAEWNTSEFNFIGSMNSECGNMLIVRSDLGYDSVQDAIGSDEPPLVMMTATPSPGDVAPVALGTMLIADYLDIPLEYKRVAEEGTSAIGLAIERGEINTGRYGNGWCRIPEQNPGWFEDDFAMPFLDMNTDGPGAFPDNIAEMGHERPPHISELLDEEQYTQYRGLVEAPRAGGNTIFLAPDTPDEIVELWRDIWATALEDEDFVETVQDTGFAGNTVRFMEGAEIQELMAQNEQVLLEFGDSYAEVAEEMFAKYVN